MSQFLARLKIAHHSEAHHCEILPLRMCVHLCVSVCMFLFMLEPLHCPALYTSRHNFFSAEPERTFHKNVFVGKQWPLSIKKSMVTVSRTILLLKMKLCKHTLVSLHRNYFLQCSGFLRLYIFFLQKCRQFMLLGVMLSGNPDNAALKRHCIFLAQVLSHQCPRRCKPRNVFHA